MPRAYSNDLREKVIQAYFNNNMPIRKLAETLQLSFGFVQKVIRNFINKGEIGPKAHGGGLPPKISTEGEEFIKSLYLSEPDLIIKEVREKYFDKFGVTISHGTMCNVLDKLKISRKKKTFYDPKKFTETNKEKHQEYLKALSGIDPKDLFFLDETGACLDETRAYARSFQGKRAYGPKPTAKGKRISSIGVLGLFGILTALCYEGTLHGGLFLYFIENFLIKELKPGQTLVIDGASPHRDEDALDVLREHGINVIFLPPYRPELNPIELCWSKVKNFIRTLKPRQVDDLYQAYEDVLKLVTSANAIAWFKHCGYFDLNPT